MLDLILVHSLFVLAAMYLGWRLVGRGRKAGCGSCPSCPSQAQQPNRPASVTLTINANKPADA